VAEEAGVSLTVDVPQTVIVDANRELVGQALANLVDNAIKHGALGAENPAVSVTLTDAQIGAELTVADNGPGISPADRSRVTDRFVRLEASRSTPGSGLGLSLVEAIANVHRGQFKLGDAGPGLKATLVFPHDPKHAPQDRS